MQGQDIALLLKLAVGNNSKVPSKILAESLCISPSEVSKSLQRCEEAGLLHRSGAEKRANRLALLEFLIHGLKYVFPPKKGPLVRGIPTAVDAEPLKARFAPGVDPPVVWPFAEGKVRGSSLAPLYKQAPMAALKDAKLYRVLALCDALREGRAREKNLAAEMLKDEINA
jgi:DNA-binding Lrp family transcriptional regulator